MTGADRAVPAETGQDWFGGLIRVRCPRCASRADVHVQDAEVRLTCGVCGGVQRLSAWPPGEPLPFRAAHAAVVSHRLDLWYEAPCCGETLWALDEVHLDYLARFVASRHRSAEFPSPPGCRQLADKFPAWLVAAKYRDEVLRVLARLAGTTPAHLCASNRGSGRPRTAS